MRSVALVFSHRHPFDAGRWGDYYSPCIQYILCSVYTQRDEVRWMEGPRRFRVYAAPENSRKREQSVCFLGEMDRQSRILRCRNRTTKRPASMGETLALGRKISGDQTAMQYSGDIKTKCNESTLDASSSLSCRRVASQDKR